MLRLRKKLHHTDDRRQSSSATVKPAFERLEERLLLTLIGVSLEYPVASYDQIGQVTYTADPDADPNTDDGLFSAVAVPMRIVLPDAEGNPVDYGDIEEPSLFQLQLQLDSSGNVIGGVDGHDLRVEGVIDTYILGQHFEGVLITGEIIEFGFQNSTATYDQYDFRFVPTGGVLVTDTTYFDGKDIGIRMGSASSNFDGDFTVDFSGEARGSLGAMYLMSTGDISGRVFLDANNDGSDAGDSGVELAVVDLEGVDYRGGEVSALATTDGDGQFSFVGLLPGTYLLDETTPLNLLDGYDTAGDSGVASDDIISEIELASNQVISGHRFGEIEESTISGFIYEDFNDDGQINFGEKAIDGEVAGVTVTLTGVDDRGQVDLTDTPNEQGMYMFVGLRPGTYAVAASQAAGFEDGLETVGEDAAGEIAPGTNDEFSALQLTAPATDGINYNFGERPTAGSSVAGGQTATIGFWQNKNGQRLLTSLNGGASATQLGNWLAATFPNLYGSLAGLTNTDVALYYRNMFKTSSKAKKKGVTGPAKLNCQIMGVAFATYVTSLTLTVDGIAADYGFQVTDYGLGNATYDVSIAYEAFGLEEGESTIMTIMNMLLATDDMSADGEAYYNMDTLLKTLANEVYTDINEGGAI